MTDHTHLIGGNPSAPQSADTVTLGNPATGEVIAEVPCAGAADAAAAVRAATKAADGWARAEAGERAAALHDLADAVTGHADELAELQTAENGKPIAMSRGDVDTAAATLRQYAELGPLHRGRALVGDWEAVDLMVHEPYGVAAVVVPWNDPLGIIAGLLGAGLVAGNTVVVKPSERATLPVLRLVELLDVPAGVCNVLLGDGRAGEALLDQPGVDLVMHVGSLATGQAIAAACAPRMAKLVLELGGNDPLIVDDDVDPVWAASQAAAGAFANAGQICTAVERLYVVGDVVDDVVDALVAEAQAMKVGDPTAEGTDMGPLVDGAMRQAVHDQVRQAVETGAGLRAGGRIPDGPGSFYPPTVLTDASPDMAIMREETFGPVAPIQAVASFQAALEAANRGPYGLAASVLTGSQTNAQRAWRELEAGTVKINDVWGGAPGGAAEPRKRSGRGFGYGPELLDEVTTTKVVHYGPLPAAARR